MPYKYIDNYLYITTIMDNNIPNEEVTALENELQQIAEEMLRPLRAGRPPSSRFQQDYFSENMRSHYSSFRGRSANEYTVYLQTLRDIMVMYNSNMSEYNTNVGTSLQLMRDLLNERNMNFTGPINVNTELPREDVPPPAVPPTPNPRRANDHLFSYILYRPTIRAEDGAAMRRFFQNIVIRPTPEQIETATHLVHFQRGMDNINVTCPITMEDFQEGELVRQIRHCRHMFNEQSIQNWFQTNVRCPVCRYDIRDYNAGTGPRPDTTTEPSPLEPPFPTDLSSNPFPGYQQLLQQIAQNFASDINNILSENIQHDPTRNLADASQNLIFQLQVETNL